MAEEQPQPATNANAPAVAPVPAVPPPPVGEAAPQPAPRLPFAPSNRPGGYYWGTGRRKTSVARVRIRPGAGKFEVNGRTVEDFFHEPKDRNAIAAPLKATDTADRLDVFANVHGGGFTGQAGAILLGLARALRTLDQTLESKLRDSGMLTRDSRMKERKKYGQKGARKRFQFSKR